VKAPLGLSFVCGWPRLQAHEQGPARCRNRAAMRASVLSSSVLHGLPRRICALRKGVQCEARLSASQSQSGNGFLQRVQRRLDDRSARSML